MFAHDPSSLQEAEIAEFEPFAEAVYDGYEEAPEGYGEFFPPPPFPPQYPPQFTMPQFRPPQITPPQLTRHMWSQQHRRMMPHRWNPYSRSWTPVGGGGPMGMPPGWQPGSTPPMRRMYMRCNMWPGPPGLVPTAAGMPGQPPYPGAPGYPGQPYPGMPGQPGAGGGGRRRRRRRR